MLSLLRVANSEQAFRLSFVRGRYLGGLYRWAAVKVFRELVIVRPYSEYGLFALSHIWARAGF